jgi:hypothetical protein
MERATGLRGIEMSAPTQATFTAPAGVGKVLIDGVFYPVVNGSVSIPLTQQSGLHALIGAGHIPSGVK